MALEELRVQIDRGLRTRRHLGHYDSRDWAIQAAPVIETVRRAVTTSPSAELVVQIQRGGEDRLHALRGGFLAPAVIMSIDS